MGWNLKELDANPHMSTKVRIGPDHVGDIPGEVQRSMEASASLSGYADDCIGLGYGLGKGEVSSSAT